MSPVVAEGYPMLSHRLLECGDSSSLWINLRSFGFCFRSESKGYAKSNQIGDESPHSIIAFTGTAKLKFEDLTPA